MYALCLARLGFPTEGDEQRLPEGHASDKPASCELAREHAALHGAAAPGMPTGITSATALASEPATSQEGAALAGRISPAATPLAEGEATSISMDIERLSPKEGDATPTPGQSAAVEATPHAVDASAGETPSAPISGSQDAPTEVSAALPSGERESVPPDRLTARGSGSMAIPRPALYSQLRLVVPFPERFAFAPEHMERSLLDVCHSEEEGWGREGSSRYAEEWHRLATHFACISRTPLHFRSAPRGTAGSFPERDDRRRAVVGDAATP